MEDYKEDRLESIELYASSSTERMLINQGTVLYRALVDAQRIDEVEVLMDAIIEFSVMASFYGLKTNRIPESLGVDLVESSLFKRSELLDGRHKPASEWQRYADNFRGLLTDVANDLNIRVNSELI